MSSGATNSGEGASQPSLVDPLVPEIQAIPEVATGVSEIDTITAKVNAIVEHEVSEGKQPGDTCKEVKEEVSTQTNREIEFVKKPGEFTTEVFKIEIRNLPRYSGYKVSVADISWARML